MVLADVIRCHEVFRVKNNMRKLKRRLEEDPGERPDPIPPGPFLTCKIQEKCGDYEPCKDEECHERKEAACLDADRMCSQWIPPPLAPSSYDSSMVGEVTKDSLAKYTQDVEKQMDKLRTATADVVSTVKNTRGGQNDQTSREATWRKPQKVSRIPGMS